MMKSSPLDAMIAEIRNYLIANWQDRDRIANEANITARHLRNIRDGKANPTAKAMNDLWAVVTSKRSAA